MPTSLRILFPGIIMGLLLIVGAILASGFIYWSYQKEIQRTINEKTTDLEVIKSVLYEPTIAYRILFFHFPELRPVFIKKTAQADSSMVYLRIVDPAGKILVSNLEEEVGEIKENLPAFLDQASVRPGEWQGKKILEISLRAIAAENLWLGVSLKPIQQAALWLAVLLGTGILGAAIVIGLILYFLLRRILLNPIMALYHGMQKVKKGNLEIQIETKSKTEIGELATTFNEMINDLRRSHTALEEAKAVLEVKVQARTKELRELAEGLEEEVKRRTKEVYEKMEELERFQRLAVGRELKMVELKKEVERLKESGFKTRR